MEKNVHRKSCSTQVTLITCVTGCHRAFAIRRGHDHTTAKTCWFVCNACREATNPLINTPHRLFPVQHEIQKLEDELNAFNDRIAELENEGHRGHAMEVLKANAIDFDTSG